MKRSVLPFVIVGVAVLASLFWWLRPAPVARSITTEPATPANATSIPAAASGTTRDAATPAPTPAIAHALFVFAVEHHRLVSGPGDLKVGQGDRVTVRVHSDGADELHLHGYDLEAPIRAGETGELSFTADRSGRFPLELHKAHLELGALEVQPSP